MRKLIFHGHLAKLCPEGLEVEASTVAEAISALRLQPQFQLPNGQRHVIEIDGFHSRDSLYERTDVREIHIRPSFIGAGGPGVLQTIIGIALIVVGVIYMNPTLIQAGIGMTIGGVIQLLSPVPNHSYKQDERSRYLSGAKNTVAIGTHIPLIYGRRRVYGHFISWDTDSAALNQVPSEWFITSTDVFDPIKDGNVPPQVPYTPLLQDVHSVYEQSLLPGQVQP